MTEDNDKDLLSTSPDDFLDKPNTDVELRKVSLAIEERNVCITLNVLDYDGQLVMGLFGKLSKLCASNQEVTDTHQVAVVVIFNESNKITRLGFCDELAANNIIYRVCESSGVDVKVYRDYGTPKQRQLMKEDLNKRPFRF